MQITKLAQWNRLHQRGRSQLIFVMFTFVSPSFGTLD